MTAPAPAVESCICGEPIIRAGKKVLDAQPDILGVNNADGTWQTAHDKVAGRPGHHTHQCAGPRDVQEELFA